MSNLPQQIKDRIEKEAKLRLIRNGSVSFTRGYYSGEISGATTWAERGQKLAAGMAEIKQLAMRRKITYSDIASVAGSLLAEWNQSINKEEQA